MNDSKWRLFETWLDTERGLNARTIGNSRQTPAHRLREDRLLESGVQINFSTPPYEIGSCRRWPMPAETLSRPRRPGSTTRSASGGARVDHGNGGKVLPRRSMTLPVCQPFPVVGRAGGFTPWSCIARSVWRAVALERDPRVFAICPSNGCVESWPGWPPAAAVSAPRTASSCPSIPIRSVGLFVPARRRLLIAVRARRRKMPALRR